MQNKEITWQAGGQQGEGLESLGAILAAALSGQGYNLYGFRQFSSRIKGGHTNYKIRIAEKPVRTVNKKCDLLVALDPETLTSEAQAITADGLIIAEKELAADFKGSAPILAVPFAELAKKHGTSLQKNIAALGATAAIIGLGEEHFAPILHREFGRKGEEAVAMNIAVFRAGWEFIVQNAAEYSGRLALPPPINPEPKMFLLGNEALALGAMSAGARFMAAYPITPASEVMEYMVKSVRQFGGQMLQVEDEIAACTMAIGASYGGARAFTATSGPGFSLMSEAIGLAAMTETPLVVINSERGGPSTGLPTKHEQSDLLAAIFNTHGDAAKIVLSPTTIEEAFTDGFEAFNLAEEYQCPVIILIDLQISLATQTMAVPDYDKLVIRRGKIIEPKELNEIKSPEYFPRYRLAEADGISPRVLPGTPNGVCLGTGLEHDEVGRPSEAKAMRTGQMEKRQRKLKTFLQNYRDTLMADAPYEEPELLLVGMTGTRGCIEETTAALRAEGRKVNHVQLRLLSPLPVDDLTPYLRAAKKILIVEHNAAAQLAGVLRMHIDACPRLESILQYDGDIMYPEQLLARCKEVL